MSGVSRIAAAAVLALLGGAAAPGVRAAAAPAQPWSSPDGTVRLLRPVAALPTRSGTPLGALMSPGWRLSWDGTAPGPGQVIVRLVLAVQPDAPRTSAREVLQVGVSHDAAVRRGCATAGLGGGSARRQPDRVINGRRFTVWSNGDAGMSQSIAATDLRTVIGDACYAVERFAYADSASDRDPAITLSQADGAARLDAALASLRLGPASAGPAGGSDR